MEDKRHPDFINTNHKIFNISCIIGLCFVYIVTVIFNALAGSGNSIFYQNNVGDLSAKYELDTTPAGWTFLIWSVIYIFMGITLIVYLVTIMKRNPENELIYLNPVVASPAYSIVYAINLLMNVGWTFLWDQELLYLSSKVLCGIAITNIITLTLLIRNLETNEHRLRKEQPFLYWTYISVAVNGHALYCTWTIIASTLNFTICLHYREGLDMQTAVDINLAILLGLTIGWVILDLLCWDTFTRFIVTPYFVVIWALSGIIVKKINDPNVSDRTKYFLKSFTLLAIVLLQIKIIVINFRQLQPPFHKKEVKPL